MSKVKKEKTVAPPKVSTYVLRLMNSAEEIVSYNRLTHYYHKNNNVIFTLHVTNGTIKYHNSLETARLSMGIVSGGGTTVDPAFAYSPAISFEQYLNFNQKEKPAT